MSKTPEQHHVQRMRAEKRFQRYGQCALGFAMLCLFVLLGSIAWRGLPGFLHTELQLTVPLNAEMLAIEQGQTPADLSPARFGAMLRAALAEKFPSASESDQREIFKLLGSNAGMVVKKHLEANPAALGSTERFWLPASNDVSLFLKNSSSEEISDAERSALITFKDEGALHRSFNTGFFTEGDSRSPENAGFLGAMAGSFFTMIVCLFAAFPLAVMAAIYLEEFSRKSWICQLIEVNVNNLAAVPSIVYGLLGLAVYINFMHLPRSASLVGGLTLALMAFPVIIIATRTALASVPPSIKQGALALGASPIQVVWHHTLPLSLPGIMTGTILGMARAIGETAPLLMIGMVAFVADIPTGFTQAATVMPVQVYLWASSPEAGFVEKTASAILVLLLLLLLMNAVAIYLRKKFEVRW